MASDRTVIEDLLIGGLHDWTHASWVLNYVNDDLDPKAARAAALSLIEELLIDGLMVAGQVTSRGHEPDRSTPREAIGRIRREWIDTRGLERPTPGAVTWLNNTAAGDALAHAVLMREGIELAKHQDSESERPIRTFTGLIDRIRDWRPRGRSRSTGAIGVDLRVPTSPHNLDLDDYGRILVAGRTDFWMQAALSGRLEFGDPLDGRSYLSLREGSEVTPLLLPFGTTTELHDGRMTILVLGQRFGLGEEIRGGGGGIEAPSTMLPDDCGLAAGREVLALQSVTRGGREYHTLPRVE